MIAAWVYAIGLLILGLILILLEIFVVPGFNVFGLLGFLTVCGGVGYAYTHMGFWPAAGVAGIGIVGTAVLVRIMLRAKAWNRLVLTSATSRDRGYDSVDPGREELIGQRGTALCALRPAGRAQFDGRIVDVVSEGGFVQSGALVEVLQVAGNKVVVQPVSPEIEAAGS
jgi:membrane-bound serine protease (ClpP class)